MSADVEYKVSGTPVPKWARTVVAWESKAVAMLKTMGRWILFGALALVALFAVGRILGTIVQGTGHFAPALAVIIVLLVCIAWKR
jgi:hypothetical protein